MAGSLETPLARIKVDEKRCFGMFEWDAVRNSASSFLPGAEQGNVDGPLECSVAVGMVAAEARLLEAGQQSAGSVPWFGASSSEEVRRCNTSSLVAQKSSQAVQENRCLSDFWYLDDGDILCHSTMALLCRSF